MPAPNPNTLEENKRRVALMLDALVILSDGKPHTGRELFQRQYAGTRQMHETWQYKALQELRDRGIVELLGPVGPMREYRLADGASVDDFLTEEAASYLIWTSGPAMLTLQEPRAKREEEHLESLFVPDEDDEDDAPAPAPPAADPVEHLLGKLLTVLEGFDARLKVIEGCIAEPASPIDNASIEVLASTIASFDLRLKSMSDRITSIADVGLAHVTAELDALKRAAPGDMGELLVETKRNSVRLQDIARENVIDRKLAKELATASTKMEAACKGYSHTNMELCVVVDQLVEELTYTKEKNERRKPRSITIGSPLTEYVNETAKKGGPA